MSVANDTQVGIKPSHEPILTCGQCYWGKLIPQDMTKRLCKGGPPTAVLVPGPRGVGQHNLWPVMESTEERCGAFRPKVMM